MKASKYLLLIGLTLRLSALTEAQNVGIGQAMPLSKLDVNGNLVVGTGYSGTFAAPPDGAIIQGNVGIGTNNPGTNRLQVSGGSILFQGDFINQSIVGAVTSIGSNDVDDANATLVTVPATGPASAATNWLPGYSTGGNQTQSCAVCNMSYFQTLPNSIGQAEVIQGTNIMVNIQDGSGVNNSGVIIFANITLKTTNNATLTPSNRYALWLQRSTDNFATNGVNLYKIEDGFASGITTGSPPNLGSGTSTSTIIYPDLNLAPGTYYYRVVYQNLMATSNGQNVTVQDRSIVALQIKQ
ncbi:MAG: hypothetical protein RML38_05500 [Bacteroidia bacterium]|nr:hypothetical protein [Bacteroidia bacterium]